jgi:hypothetical protein
MVPGIALAVTVVLGALVDTLSGQDIDYQIKNPIGIEGLTHVEDMPLVLGVLGVSLLVGCVGGAWPWWCACAASGVSNASR